MELIKIPYVMNKKKEFYEKDYLMRTIKYFLERYNKLDACEEETKTEIDNTKTSLIKSLERNDYISASLKADRLWKTMKGMARTYSRDVLTKYLKPWIERSGSGSVNEKLGFLIEVPAFNCEKQWILYTIHSFSFGANPPFSNKRLEPTHLGDLERIIFRQKKGQFFAQGISYHGVFCPKAKKLGHYANLEDVFSDWSLEFTLGDHATKMVKEKTDYKMNVITQDFIKNKLKIDFFDYYEKTLKTDRVVDKKISEKRMDKKKLKVLRKIIMQIPSQHITDKFFDFAGFSDLFKEGKGEESSLLSFFTEEDKEIDNCINELSDSMDSILGRIYRVKKACEEKPKAIEKLFAHIYPDLPLEAKLLLPVSLDMLTERPVYKIYPEKASMKRKAARLVAWATNPVYRGYCTAKRYKWHHWRGWKQWFKNRFARSK